MPGINLGSWIYLIVMMGVIIVMLYFTMRFLQTKVQNFGSGTNMKIIETLPVSQKGLVHIVKIGEEFVLLGVTDNQVTYLKSLDDIEITEREMPEVKFKNVLNNFMKREDDHEK